jgi:single-strand DNA-binding protein
MNRVILIGFLGKDAEVKTTRNNAAFTVLSLATSRRWKNRETGEYESETTWHRCIAWGKLGTFAAGLAKGAHVQLEGEIRTRQYQPKADSGNRPKSITEVRVTSLAKLDRANRPTGEPPAGGSLPRKAQGGAR